MIGLTIATQQVQAQDVDIEEIEVLGSRAALMSALNKQRNSDQVIGVIDSDAMGNFADINVSESLRRISGIMVENDQGEGRYVSVRGMNADLNAMTINGVSTASPEDRRGIMLDGVPTDILDSMTVYKTLTPKLDADTIGGVINLETISAFSRDGSYFRIKAETSYNELTEDANNPTFSATGTHRFQIGSGELGVAVVLSDQSRHIIANNNENGGWSEEAPNDDYEMRYYDLTRDRQGFAFNLDYRTENGQTYYAHMFNNEYTDTEYRAKWETRDGLEDNEPVVNGSIFTYANTRMDNEARHRIEVRKISALQLGAEFELDNGSELSFEFFGSEAEQDDGDKNAVIFRSSTVDVPVTYDNSNPKKPSISYASAFYAADTFELKAFEAETSLTTDEDMGFKADMSYLLNIGTELEYGFKYRQREKENNENFCGYEPLNDISLSNFETQTLTPYLNSVHGPAPTIAAVRSYIANLGQDRVALSDGTTCQAPGNLYEFSGDEEEESIPADWKTQEDILALYLMATTKTDRTTFVYGVRYEDTESTYTGKNFDGNTYAGLGKFERAYDFWAPSFNIKYEIDDQRIARLGIFRSLVRPGFKESRAGALIDVDDNEIEGGNPALNPTIAWNFDATLEYYLSEETFIGGGVFYKSIEDSVVAVKSNNLMLQGKTWNIAETYLNTDDSSILGLEFSLQTAWDNGLLLVVNYTHVDGETDLPVDSVNGQRTIPYFKQAKNTANVVFGYDKNALDIRLALNYRSSYLDEVGDDVMSDRYTSEHMQVDLTARYKVNDHLLIIASAINLNDRPEYYYFGDESRLSQYDEYGTTYTFGLRYIF